MMTSENERVHLASTEDIGDGDDTQMKTENLQTTRKVRYFHAVYCAMRPDPEVKVKWKLKKV